jgi:hypothetical protein
MMTCSFVFSSRTLPTYINYHYLVITATLTTAEPVEVCTMTYIYTYASVMDTADKTIVKRLITQVLPVVY